MKRICSIALLTLSMLAGLLLIVQPSYSQQIKVSLPEINKQSDLILKVQVESITSEWVYGSEGKNIVTTNTLRVLESIKGEYRVNEVFTLDMLGGKVGDTSQFVSNSVVFTKGEESVVFLQKSPKGMVVTADMQGRYKIANNMVKVENQPVKSATFIEILKEAVEATDALPGFIQSLKHEPKNITEKSSGGIPLKSTTDTYAVSAVKADFTGTTDADGDGYFEAFTFTLQINGDADPGPAVVYFRINCVSVTSWVSVNSYTITGNVVDNKNFGFDQSNFAGLISPNSELTFTVDMLAADRTTVLATDSNVTGDAIKVDVPAAPTFTISAISPSQQSAGTNSTVAISGSGFGASQGSGKVEFNYSGGSTIEAPVVSWSETQITCIVPVGTVDGYPASAGSGPVTVTNSSGARSNAFNYRVTFGYGGIKWPVNSMTYRINENLASVNGEGQAIQNAGNTWNSANSNFKFLYGGVHTNTTVGRNYFNDMLWGTVAGGSTIAQASTWFSGGTIIECDIVFNSSFNWSASGTPSGTMDVETIALHEMGHWLNLRDLYGSFNDGIYDQAKIMYGMIYYGQSKRTLHADDIGGIQWIYGAASTISISGYVKTGAGVGVSGVLMNGLPGSVTTNSAGFYTADVGMGFTGSVTPVKTGYTFTLTSRNYSNQTSSLTDQDFTATVVSNIATLSDLKVSGTTVAGFSASTLNYSVQLPAGTTAVPAVTATTTDSNATKLITAAAAIPGTTTVRVTAQDGTTVITYSVAFTLPAASTDATLSDLKASGSTVSGFVKTTLSYAIILPYGTTAVPTVTATATDSKATKVITAATSLPGNTTVLVTAEDGTTKLTYTISFSVAKNNDASLADLKVSGTTVTGFVKTTLTYNVLLPFGTTAVPAVTATTTDSNATKQITAATALPGTTTVRVTAQDGTTVITYSVTFTLPAASTDATLSDLKASGSTVSGFVKTTLNYAIILPYGTTAVPTVTATATDSKATKVITAATSLPGNTAVQVTAEDGTTKLTYTISFSVAKNNDASLSDLKVSGTTVTGFVKTTLTYNVLLPFGTTAIPSVTVVLSDSNATRLITAATALPGSTTILVTAENGTTTQTYTVYFTVQAPSAVATLADLKINGVSVGGFHANTTTYTMELPWGTTSVPTVTANATSPVATMAIQATTALPGITTILVTAQDGTTKKTYAVAFTVALNNNATLSDLKVSGVSVSGFTKTLLSYAVILPYGTTVVPVVTAEVDDANATRQISQATSLPGITSILVTAENGTTKQTYTVNFTVNAGSSVATLSNLMANGATIGGFNPTVGTYAVTLPYGTTAIPVVSATTTDPLSTKVIYPATSLPGSASVIVFSQNGLVTKTYTIYFSLAKNSDATLSNLMADGGTVSGFASSMLNYNTLLPFETTVVPVVSAIPTDARATLNIMQATSLPGLATVQVTAEDGTTTKTYMVAFSKVPPATDATLSSLQIDGSPVQGFQPGSLHYQKTLPYGTTRVPDIQAVAASNKATIVIMRAVALPGVSTIQVTAQDGSTRNTYSMAFFVAKNDVATLANIIIEGASLPNFNANTFNYVLTLPAGTQLPPAITAVPTDPSATFSVTLPDTYPGTATIRVIAEDGVTTTSYQIFVSITSSAIGDQAFDNTLKVYPNPNNGTFQFEYNSNEIKPIRVSLLDLTGRVIFDRQYEGSGFLIQERIEISQSQKGVYLLRVLENGKAGRYFKVVVE